MATEFAEVTGATLGLGPDRTRSGPGSAGHPCTERNRAEHPQRDFGLVGTSAAIQTLLGKLLVFCAHDAPVLIEGETGTGKELVARALHYSSPRHGEPFVPVNCAAIPENLIVNELFGHRRGAFTGAEARQIGLIEQAGGGTILLDEVDTLPLAAQASLLRFLQDHQYRPLGGAAPQTANVRIVAATNAHIEARVRDGRFREDLYYRLNVLTLRLPPLRERPEDVPLLGRHFLVRLRHRYGGPAKRISDEVLAALGRHDWPGNVRELENRLHRAYILSTGPEIACADLELPGCDGGSGPSFATGAHACGTFAAAKAQAVASFEYTYLSRLMTATGGNISAASRMAKKERRTLSRLLKKHGIERREFQPDGR